MKKIGIYVLLAITSLFVISCGKSDKGLESSVNKNQTLIIYTNSGSQGRKEWLIEKAKKSGYDLRIVEMGGSDLANRLIAEKNNSQADLFFGINSIETEKLKKEGLLLKFKPNWADEVDPLLADKEGFYYPITIQPLVLIYNSELVNPPKDWTDLVNEKYADQFTLLKLDGGTGKTIYASILARYLDPKGDMGVSEEGWNKVRDIFKNGHFQVSGEDSIGNVINGSRPMTTMWGSGVLQNQSERNYKFVVMSPEVGVPYVVEQTAVISKTKKSELAKEFLNWFGSPEIQLEWSNRFGTIPASKTAQLQVSDDIKEFMNKVHPQEIDWDILSKNIDQWVEKAELKYIH